MLNPIFSKRSFSDININSFIQSLTLYDWDTSLAKFSCPSETLECVMNVIKYFFDTHFPVKKYPARKIEKVWISDRSVQLRNSIHRTKQLILQNSSDESNLTHTLIDLETQFAVEVKQARKQYVNDLIFQSENISRGVWRAVASETCRDGKRDALDLLISKSAGNCACERAATVASDLNRFYVDANKNINVKPCIQTALDYLAILTPKHTKVFECELFSMSELINTIRNIKRKDSTDINDMSTRVLEYLPELVLGIFCEYFNRCLLNGQFPDVLKIVKVQPIYKGKGEMDALKNYRPISLIPIMAKVLEKLMSRRLMSYFNANNLLNTQQYAYQAGRSTADATRDVLCKVMHHLESRRHTAAIFCDLSRAFELVNHSLLLEKLMHYGINGPFLNMISSFLGNRVQLTSVHCTRSTLKKMGDHAVPQGSIMGNYLFLILMNDLTTSSTDAEYVMFADDGCVIVAAEDNHNLNIKLNKVMNEVSKWFDVNGMALNVEKTNIVHFRLGRKNSSQLKVVCNGLNVPQVDKVKYLGFVIDESLTWGPHIDLVCGRLSSACFALSRLCGSLHVDNIKKAYFGYFHSLMMYGIEMWGLAAERERIFKLQKRAVRIMSGVEWDHPARELFKTLNILTVPCQYILQVAKYIRKNLQQFSTWADSHNYGTRRKHQLRLPLKRLSKSQKQIDFVGIKIYNTLPEGITNASSNSSFTAKLKTLLLKRAYYDVNEFYADKLTDPH